MIDDELQERRTAPTALPADIAAGLQDYVDTRGWSAISLHIRAALDVLDAQTAEIERLRARVTTLEGALRVFVEHHEADGVEFDACTRCVGTGEYYDDDIAFACGACHGSGEVEVPSDAYDLLARARAALGEAG